MVTGPITCPQKIVKKEWIDYNGHMNMAYYVMVFDQCLDHVYDQLGIGEDYVSTQQSSCFTREIQVNYLRELTLGDPIRVDFQLLDWDAKRLHFFETMRHAAEGFVAATSEQLALHVDLTSRRTAPFPDAVQARLNDMMAAHQKLAIPPEVGQRIGIRRQ